MSKVTATTNTTTLTAINNKMIMLTAISNDANLMFCIDNAIALMPKQQLDAPTILDALIENNLTSLSDVRNYYAFSLKTYRELRNNDVAQSLKKQLDVLNIKLSTLLEFLKPTDKPVIELKAQMSQLENEILILSATSTDTDKLKQAKAFFKSFAYLFLSELPMSVAQELHNQCLAVASNSKDYSQTDLELNLEFENYLKTFLIK